MRRAMRGCNTALDACYVLCHEARTADVVKGIKQSLKSESMDDVTLSVHGDAGERGKPRTITMRRRPAFARLKLFVPRVTWVEADGTRRELVYRSDILDHLDWQAFDPSHLAQHWAPNTERKTTSRFDIDLSILDRQLLASEPSAAAEPLPLDRARLVRALHDLAPNAWLVWSWLEHAVARLLAQGFSEAALASASASLTERLRVDVEAERDRLAQTLFNRLVGEGRIEFRLRADATDYEQALLQRLSEASRDERRHKAGELVLEGPADEEVRCNLIIDHAWQGALEAR